MNLQYLKQIQPHEVKVGDFIYYTLHETTCYIVGCYKDSHQYNCKIIQQEGQKQSYIRDYNFFSGDIYLIGGEQLNILKAQNL